MINIIRKFIFGSKYMELETKYKRLKRSYDYRVNTHNFELDRIDRIDRENITLLKYKSLYLALKQSRMGKK